MAACSATVSLAALAQVFVARPRSHLDPFGDIEQSSAEPVRADRADRSPVGLGAGLVEGAAGLGESRIAAMRCAHRLQNVDLEHVEIAGRPELVRDPFQLGLDPLLLGIGDDLLEGDDGGTHAAQADAHLMQGIGIARAHAALVDDDLPQAILRDGAESLPAGEAAIEMDPRRLLGFRRGAARKLIAALGLGLHREAQWHACGEPARHGKNLRRIALLQLELDLMHGRPALGGLDRAAVDGNLDFGTVAFDLVDAALDAGLEQRPQAFACIPFNSGSSGVPAIALKSGWGPAISFSHSGRSNSSPGPSPLIVCT